MAPWSRTLACSTLTVFDDPGCQVTWSELKGAVCAALAVLIMTSGVAFAAAPLATTSAATSISSTSAVLNGSANPGSEASTAWFRISSSNPVTCDDTFGSRVPASGGTDVGSGGSNVPYSITTTGLVAGTTYYFCAIASNTSGKAFGAVLSFTVPAPPQVVSVSATAIGSSSATLGAFVNPLASSTTGWFRYHSADPGSCSDSFGVRVPTSGGTNLGAGATPVEMTRAISGLLPGATYHYCAIASNDYGTTFSAVSTFTTAAVAPTVSTTSATSLSGTGATLNGSANPGGAATTGWFRYDTVSPGTCNDSFGTRAPSSLGADLGSGNSSAAFAQAITGLTPGLTYYYCAVAENRVGKSFGALNTFITPSPPTVTTTAAASVTDSSATLTGRGAGNRAATTGWFRYSATEPQACNDTFGSRAPVSGGSSLGSSTSEVTFSQSIGSLSSGTVYYFCAIAQNSEGFAFGEVLSFRTASAPTVTTVAASSVTTTSATLNGTGTSNGGAGTAWFRYATTSPGTCSDSFGTRAPTSSGTSLASDAVDAPFARSISGLLPGTTYHFCAILDSPYDTAFGAVLSFTTPAAAPLASTSSATGITGAAATLTASGNPSGASTLGWLRYDTVSPGTCNDTFGTRAPASGGSDLGAGNGYVSYSVGITGLSQGTTYYYCAIVENSVSKAFGSVLSFATPSAPVVTTTTASSVSYSSATLGGSGVANRSLTTGWFRYGTTEPASCSDTFGSRAPTTGGSNLGSSTGAVAFSQSVSGLSLDTTYYYCAVASNAEGTSFGAVQSFRTSGAPVFTTLAASAITPTGATLNGTGNPTGSPGLGWFRYSTTDPGTCTDTFGTRAPTSGATSVGSDRTEVAFSRSISGLLPGTTVYFCALGYNSYDFGYGEVLSFTTPAAAPLASTSSAAATSTTATLNASGNPGGATTLGWFRYDTVSPGTCNDTFGTRAPTTGGTDLGKGNSYVAYTAGLTGLTPATTYYYCAVVESSVGKAFGSVLSFTTASPPTVTTLDASSIADSSARLNGQGVPNRSATTGWFRISATAPTSCDDTFGSRLPSTGGTNLGTGTSAVAFNQTASGLSIDTTYYYCAIASSVEGTVFGQVLSFRTVGSPTMTTLAASSVTSTSAVLNGSGLPNGSALTGWFRYSGTNPGTCTDSFGTRNPTSSGTNLGSGFAEQTYARTVSGLLPGTTTYFCAIGANTYDYDYGEVLSFTTPPAAPLASTSSATGITGAAATLTASGNPSGASTLGWLRYDTVSPGTCNDTFGTRAPASGGSDLGAGNGYVSYSVGITGLSQGTTYYYCAIVENSVSKAFGSVLSFATPSAPVVTTTTASSVSYSSATLGGSGVANRSLTTGWFRYGTTEPASCSDTFGSRAPTTGGSNLGSSTGAVAFSQSVSGLSLDTTYYYCAVASNAEGTSFGAVQSFRTSGAPVFTTLAASAITPTGATLNGTGNPTGSPGLGWFRYSTTDPGTCTDTFGTRAPTSGATSVGSDRTEVAFSRSISGLLPGTTVYFCALGYNSYDFGYGEVLSFTTPAAAPLASTSSAAATSTTATLNASGNPGGATTLGWFRYDTVSPGTCNDTFGTRSPTSAGTDLGKGNSYVAYTGALTGLTPATTYYYCAVVENSVAKAFGSVLSFTTASPPTVTTLAASSVTNAGARLNGEGVANRAATTGWFRISATAPAACNDTFGSRLPATGGTNLGTGTSAVPFNQSASNLSSDVTYYYCAIASSAEGTVFGEVLSFITATAPTFTTTAATNVMATLATLNGEGAGNGSVANGWFRYATLNPGVCSDSFGVRAPTSGVTALGSSRTATPYARLTSTLLPGTTYYFCALGYNDYEYAFGDVLSFTTPATAPTITTRSSTTVTTTSAQLNADVNPGGAATTVWYRYDTISPGTCNDTYGVRVPGSGGTVVPAGTSTVANNQPAAGLSPGTTYYVCAIAENAVGKVWGSVVSFTTQRPPTVLTLAATPITATTASLNGTGNPAGNSATAWFRYSTTAPTSCDDSFGTRAPASGASSLGGGNSSVPYSQAISGLVPATTYHFCAVLTNVVGTVFGEVLSFTTPAAAPSVTTLAATAVGTTGATLQAAANANGSAATGWFRYSTSNPGTCNDSFGTRTPTTGGTALGAGVGSTTFNAPVTGLTLGVTYYFCALVSNDIGTATGAVLSFSTTAAPAVVTKTPTGVTGTTATLQGEANPNGTSATGWFRYSTTNPGSCSDSFGTRAPSSLGTALGSGSASVPFSAAVTGLLPGTAYFVCAIANNASGTGFGAVERFTMPQPPTVVTAAVTDATSTGATLRGSANPNGGAATGWFRYSTTSPGTCNDSFGTRAPVSSGTALGSGTEAVAFSQPIGGLAAATTYYVCALGSNGEGTSFGAVVSFSTPVAPTVVLDAPTVVRSTTATLNARVNPNGSSTEAWFRYSATDPGGCDDLFGTATVKQNVGGGAALVPVSQNLTSLVPGTTYYVCALAENASGLTFDAPRTFVTPAAPVTTTLAAANVTGTTATLKGSAVPNGATAEGWFRYSTTSPGSCDNSFGTRTPSSGGSPLGAGGADVPFEAAIASLTPGVTVFYCAIAENAEGIGFGSMRSFTPPAPTVVTTLDASLITGDSATLNGEANPQGVSTSAWFRYSTTDPGTCNDSFGTRAPTSSGVDLGTGNATVPFSLGVTGLAGGTAYYVCALASNSSGLVVGAVRTFTTLGAPSVLTDAATAVTSDTAQLRGTGNPNLSDTLGWFRYGTTDPGACNDSFGLRAPTSGGEALGAGSAPVAFTRTVTGLLPATTYYYCAIVSSAVDTSFGAVRTFTTLSPPSVVTGLASGLTDTSAIIAGDANPNGLSATGWFRWSSTDPGTCNDSFGTRAPSSGGSALGSGRSPVPYTQELTGLLPDTTYHYCALASNSEGTRFGNLRTFTTPAQPTVTTTAAVVLSRSSARLEGRGNPNGTSATGWFRYDTSRPNTCDDSFGVRAPASGGSSLGAGRSEVPFVETVTGLQPSTTYYACAAAGSAVGTVYGEVVSFRTPDAPSAITLTATAVGPGGATLQGSVNPNGGETVARFRYATTSPGACNDSFGATAPSSGSVAVGRGVSVVPISEPVTGLLAATTYHYCLIATSPEGTSFGNVLTFTTEASVPSVTTAAASGITSTSALLNGRANPNGASTSAWFRYDLTRPVSCDDSFGTRVPASGATALGGGTSEVPFAEGISGLTPGAIYHYCAIAQNSAGVAVGQIQSFSPGVVAPSVITVGSRDVGTTSATLLGQANPNGSASAGWFRYGSTNPGTCDDTFGTRLPSSAGVSLGAGTAPVAFEQAVGGLLPNSTVYFCAGSDSLGGAAHGLVQSLTTASAPPLITTEDPTYDGVDVTVTGTGNPQGSSTVGWFWWDDVDPGTCEDALATGGSRYGETALGDGRADVVFSTTLPTLPPGTWYVCAFAGNVAGVSSGEVATIVIPDIGDTDTDTLVSTDETDTDETDTDTVVSTDETDTDETDTDTDTDTDTVVSTDETDTDDTAETDTDTVVSTDETDTDVPDTDETDTDVPTTDETDESDDSDDTEIGDTSSTDTDDKDPGSSCGCAQGSGGAAPWMLALGVAVAMRRRRVQPGT